MMTAMLPERMDVAQLVLKKLMLLVLSLLQQVLVQFVAQAFEMELSNVMTITMQTTTDAVQLVS